MAARLPGYRRGGIFNRGYITPEGREISYREYRRRVEQQGAVKRLSAVELANARRRQKEFNNIVRQMAKIRGQALDAAIENTEAAMERAREAGAESAALEELSERLGMHRRMRRRVKQEAIRSPFRKEAIKEIEEASKRRVTRRGIRRYKNKEDELNVRNALIVLGRRNDVPEYVPVGWSDKPRSWGRFKTQSLHTMD